MISRSDSNFQDLFNDYINENYKSDEEHLTHEALFEDIERFIIKVHNNKNTDEKQKIDSSIEALIAMLQSLNPYDYDIYEDGGKSCSLVTGDYEFPSDGHEPLLLANYYEICNEKTKQSIFLIEIKDNSSGDYWSSPHGSERLLLEDYYVKPNEAELEIEKHFKAIHD